MACGGLLQYLTELEKAELGHINHLSYYVSGQFMELDLTARRNLELTETLRNQERRGSLLWVIDKTKTAMGGRMLRSFLEKPLLNPEHIKERSDGVKELLERGVDRQELQLIFGEISDMERSMGRIVAGTANARDLLSMGASMLHLPRLQLQLAELKAPIFRELRQELDLLEDLCGELRRAIVDQPPFTVREGGMIRTGYDKELDRLRDIMSGGTETLQEIEAQEREKTGIPKLKVSYNRVFGYYIEVSKSYQDRVPGDLYPQADPGELRTLCDPGAQGTGVHHSGGQGPHYGAGVRDLHPALDPPGGQCRPGAEDLQRGGGQRCAGGPCRGGVGVRLCAAGGGPVRRDPYSGRAAPGGGTDAAGFPGSCPTTRSWMPPRGGSPSSRGPTWRANPPICARWH